MGMVHAMQKGEKVKGASPELKKAAKTMSKKDVKDFASTSHKGLPKRQVTEARNASAAEELKFHKKLDRLVHDTFGKRPEEMTKLREIDTGRRGFLKTAGQAAVAGTAAATLAGPSQAIKGSIDLSDVENTFASAKTLRKLDDEFSVVTFGDNDRGVFDHVTRTIIVPDQNMSGVTLFYHEHGQLKSQFQPWNKIGIKTQTALKQMASSQSRTRCPGFTSNNGPVGKCGISQ